MSLASSVTFASSGKIMKFSGSGKFVKFLSSGKRTGSVITAQGLTVKLFVGW